MWFDRHPSVTVILASILVHGCVLGAVAFRAGQIDAYALRSLDCGEYYTIARNVAEYGAFSQDTEQPFKPDTWRTPGYPLFLAVFIAVLGASPAALVVVQQGLCVFNVWLLFGIARAVMGDRRAAMVAGLFLLEPYHLLYSLWLLPTTLFVTVLLLIWRTWGIAVKRRVAAAYALMGVLAGALVLIWPVGVLVVPALVVGIWFSTLRHRRLPGASHSAAAPAAGITVFSLCCILVVGSWMLRNRVVAGHTALSHQGGIVLAYFKAAEVELWRQGRTADRYLETSLDPSRADRPHTVWDAIDVKLREKFPHLDAKRRSALRWQNLAQGNKTDVDSFALSAALTQIGWSSLAAIPLSTVTCCLSRCGAALTFPLNLALAPPNGVKVDRSLQAVRAIPYVALCLLVFVRLARRGLRFDSLYLPLACVAALALATTPQLDPRFRIPMIPFLLYVAFLPSVRTVRKGPAHARDRLEAGPTYLEAGPTRSSG